ncbi:MAG: hypothetical protein N4A65_00270 [Cohaesibacter sp.]|nr:hypothetical protein [Cohaesibacter sp.]
MSNNIERDIGKLQADVEHLQEQITSMQRDIRAMRDAALSVKGGWKMIITIGSIGAALSALLFKFLPFLGMRP